MPIGRLIVVCAGGFNETAATTLIRKSFGVVAQSSMSPVDLHNVALQRLNCCRLQRSIDFHSCRRFVRIGGGSQLFRLTRQ